MLKLTREGKIQLARTAVQMTMCFATSVAVSAVMRAAMPVNDLTKFGLAMFKIGNYAVSSAAGELSSEYFGRVFDSLVPNDVPHLFEDVLLPKMEK